MRASQLELPPVYLAHFSYLTSMSFCLDLCLAIEGSVSHMGLSLTPLQQKHALDPMIHIPSSIVAQTILEVSPAPLLPQPSFAIVHQLASLLCALFLSHWVALLNVPWQQ